MVIRSSGRAPADWLAVAEQALPDAAGDPVLQAAIHSELSWAALFVNDLERALAHARTAAALAERGSTTPRSRRRRSTRRCSTWSSPPGSRAPGRSTSALWSSSARRRTSSSSSRRASAGLPRAARPATWPPPGRTSRRRRAPARERGDESGLARGLRHADDARDARRRLRAGRGGHAGRRWSSPSTPASNWHERCTPARCSTPTAAGSPPRSRPPGSSSPTPSRAGRSSISSAACSVLGFLELSRGDATAACPALERATEAAAALGIGEPGLLRCVPDHVEALVARGECDRAERADRRASRRRRRRLERAWALADGGPLRGLVLAARGDWPPPGGARARRGRAPPVRDAVRAAGARCWRSAPRSAAPAQRRAARESLAEALGDLRRPRRAAVGRQGTRGARPDRRPHARRASSLTPTEARIAELVAPASTNREVAAELVVTVHTVEAALTRIYAKLGVRSRTELAAGSGAMSCGPRRRR